MGSLLFENVRSMNYSLLVLVCLVGCCMGTYYPSGNITSITYTIVLVSNRMPYTNCTSPPNGLPSSSGVTQVTVPHNSALNATLFSESGYGTCGETSTMWSYSSDYKSIYFYASTISAYSCSIASSYVYSGYGECYNTYLHIYVQSVNLCEDGVVCGAGCCSKPTYCKLDTMTCCSMVQTCGGGFEENPWTQ